MPDDDLIVDEENQGFEEPKDPDETEPTDDHEIPEVASIDDGPTEESQFTDPIASPAVVGEQDVFSGDATSGEAADIDDELAKVGLENDADGPKDLSSDDID